VQALDDFYKMMARDSARAFYGPGHVFAAAGVGGIETLLLTDALFRTNDPRQRRKYAELVASVKDAGGEGEPGGVGKRTGWERREGDGCGPSHDLTIISSIISSSSTSFFLYIYSNLTPPGEVLVFSSGHSSGEQLTQLSGIAALLRFPMPEIEDEEVQPPEELRG
jgi:protein pelota